MKNYPLSLIWTLIVVVLSLKPNPEMPNLGILHIDKAVHFGFYFFYTLFLTFEMRKYFQSKQYSKFSNRFIAKIAFGLPFLVGFVVELIQGFFVAGRMFDVWDICANGLGAAVATLFGVYYLKVVEK